MQDFAYRHPRLAGAALLAAVVGVIALLHWLMGDATTVLVILVGLALGLAAIYKTVRDSIDN